MSSSFDELVRIMDRLRSPGGCPWDREQTLESLAPYVIEEAHEVADAVLTGDPAQLCEELGDLLLQIVFMARIASESRQFDIDKVCEVISDKMQRRHPHVFGEDEVETAEQVLRNWENIKVTERSSSTNGHSSALDGIPPTLPSLLAAYRMTEKAAALGFDWQRPLEVVDKLREEVEELADEVASHAGAAGIKAEMGDVLFAMANLARHLKVEPETALAKANGKFKRRFQTIEQRLHVQQRRVNELSLEELDRLWEEVKAGEADP